MIGIATNPLFLGRGGTTQLELEKRARVTERMGREFKEAEHQYEMADRNK